MSGKLSEPLGLRLKDSTLTYFKELSKKDKRLTVEYLRAILETVEEKGLTLQSLSALPTA